MEGFPGHLCQPPCIANQGMGSPSQAARPGLSLRCPSARFTDTKGVVKSMSIMRKVSQIAAIVGLCLLCCTIVSAQTVNSVVVGRVVDPAGAVVAGGEATLTDQNTGAVRTATTDATGVYRFPDLL